MKKVLLILLVIVCILAAGYTGYLLFTHQTDPVIGVIIFLADVGVLIWNISILRRYRYHWYRRKFKAVKLFTILLAVALVASASSAYAGVEPLASAKSAITDWLAMTIKAPTQELRAEVIEFQRTQNANEVVFFVDIEMTERTAKEATYTIEVLVDGDVINTSYVFVTKDGAIVAGAGLPIPVTHVRLIAYGQAIQKMLNDLNEKYLSAKTEYEEFEAKHLWDIMTGHERIPSWEGVKKLQEEEEQLATEMKKWETLRAGKPFSYDYPNDLHKFCTKYIQLRVYQKGATQ